MRPPLLGKRSRIVYQLTAEGKEHFAELLDESGPSAWDDEGFGVHFAFFGRTDAQTPAADPRGPPVPAGGAAWTASGPPSPAAGSGSTATPSQLQQHGLESVEREVRWLTELIDDERRRRESPEDNEIEPPEKEHP